jgi:flagellar hook-associated protein 3 FlgL
MRVTNEMMVTNSVRRLHTRLSAYEQAQSQLATGRRILKPSDDPSGASRALALRATRRSTEQQVRNGSDAKERLQVADTQLQTVSERYTRVRELLTRGASSTGPTERAALAQEVAAIRDELSSLANGSYAGKPLFSGWTDGPAVERAADGTWQQRGGGQQVSRRIGDDETVQVNITAQEVFGFTADSDSNVFALLDRAEAALSGGDTDAVAASLGELEGARATVETALGRIGAAGSRVESALDRSEAALLSLRGELAQVEDVDMAEAVMELQVQEVAYEAVLSALAKALPASLASFLR